MSSHVVGNFAFQNFQMKIYDENSQNILEPNPPTELKKGLLQKNLNYYFSDL